MYDLARFSLRLVCGIALMWCLMPRRDVSSGFFRIQMLVALGLSVLAAVAFAEAEPPDSKRVVAAAEAVLSTTTGRNLSIVLALATFCGSVLWTLERRSGGTWLVFGIAGVSAATLLLATPLPSAGAGPTALAYVSELSAAGLLGAALTGMLLGHWYLTAPTMSLAPLERMTSAFGGAAVVRLLVAGVCLWFAHAALESTTHLMWLALRWVAGVIAPLVLWLMVRKILRYRNTQAATGVLFVAVILTFIGEMTALLLEHDLGRPL
jgi:hypothetical protein